MGKGKIAIPGTHVGDQAPLGLHDGDFAVSGAQSNVGAKGDLQPTAETHAVQDRDNRHRNFTPQVADILGKVGDGGSGGFGKELFKVERVGCNTDDVKTGAKGSTRSA